MRGVPARVHRLLKRCLEKDPQHRLRHIGDVMSLLDDTPGSPESRAAALPRPAATRRWLWPAAAGLLDHRQRRACPVGAMAIADEHAGGRAFRGWTEQRRWHSASVPT